VIDESGDRGAGGRCTAAGLTAAMDSSQHRSSPPPAKLRRIEATSASSPGSVVATAVPTAIAVAAAAADRGVDSSHGAAAAAATAAGAAAAGGAAGGAAAAAGGSGGGAGGGAASDAFASSMTAAPLKRSLTLSGATRSGGDRGGGERGASGEGAAAGARGGTDFGGLYKALEEQFRADQLRFASFLYQDRLAAETRRPLPVARIHEIVRECVDAGAGNAFFGAIILMQTRSIFQDRLGTNSGNVEKDGDAFSGRDEAMHGSEQGGRAAGNRPEDDGAVHPFCGRFFAHAAGEA
jgi:hypothetical protein